MTIEWAPFISFVLVASFSPGPNNLNAAAMGMDGGFRQTLPFIFGVYVGVALLLCLVGFLKIAVSEFFYRYILIFKIAGSAYLLYLAFTMVRNTGGMSKGRSNVSFLKGITLQLINPKALFFAMTIYALFLSGSYSGLETLLVSFSLPIVAFFSVSAWAIGGSFLSRYLEKPLQRRIFFWICALLLVYTVVTILTQEFTAQ